MNKAKQVDALLRRIVARLELGQGPSIEDGAAFDELLWSYRESEPRNISKIVGLRNRIPYSPPKQELGDTSYLAEQMRITEGYFRQGNMPPRQIADEFIQRANAYLNKNITAAKFLGERDRNPRNGNTWQAESSMGAIAEIVYQRVKTKGDNPLSTLPPVAEYTLYTLLVELHQDTCNSKLIYNYELADTELTKQILDDLKALISSESEHADDTFIAIELLKLPGRWYAAHRKFLSR